MKKRNNKKLKTASVPFYGRILPTLIAWITGKPRYLPDVIEWADKSWTHNAFRIYELIFWRRRGIRIEASTAMWQDENGKAHVVHAAHTIEAACALTETYIRNMLAAWKPIRIRVYIPVLATPQGIPVFASPYLFAIALDNAVPTGDMQFNTNVTFTCTGSDRYLATGNLIQTTGAGVTGQTYNSVSMTQINSIINNGASSEDSFLYGLHAPATGANSIVFTTAAGTKGIIAAAYTGVNQSTTPDAQTTVKTSGSVATFTLTTTVADCWLMAYFRTNNTFTSAGAGTTSRNSPLSGTNWSDSNGALSQGSNSLVMNLSSANYAINGMSLAPVAGTNYTKSITETITMVDTVKRDTAKILADAFSLVDNVSRGAGKMLADVITLVDTVDIIQIFTQALTETITLIDNVRRDTAKILTEAVTLVDNVARAAARTLIETITLVDSFAYSFFYSRMFTETITLADSIRKDVAKTITETITLVDTAASRLTAILLTDVFTLVDSQSVVHGFIKMLTETISLNDVLTKTLAYSRAFTESITLHTRLFLNGVNAAWLLKYAQKATTWIGKYTDPK